MSNKAYKKYVIALAVLAIVSAGYSIYKSYIKPLKISVKPVPHKKLITVFFYNPVTDTLKPEQRHVVPAADLLGMCREIIGELERGSHTGLTIPIPADTKVNAAILRHDGVVSIDLSGNIISETPEGSSAELTAIYAIVNSIAQNVDGVKAVLLTIDGKRLETLETHIEIDEPIVPDYTK